MRDLRAVPTLAEVLDAPERALDLAPAEAAAMLAKAEGLAAVLRARVTATPPAPAAPTDRLLTADEAAPLLGLRDRKAVYRRRWPFAVRVGPGTVRYSEQGLAKFLKGAAR